MLKQPRSLRCNPPLSSRQLAPGIHLHANRIDDGGVVVLLFLSAEPLAFIKNQTLLAFAFAGFGYGCDEVRPAATFNDFLCWLAFFVQLPVATGVLVGRVKDRLLEKEIGHPVACYCWFSDCRR